MAELLVVCASPLNQVFLAVISLCLVVGGAWRKHSELFANCAATLGMLGTFVGIMHGLMGFNADDIQKSVPPLLIGMKTAFLTSIAGLIVFLLLRVTSALLPRRIGKIDVATVKPEHLLLELRAIRNALNADQDGSLITQLQKIRTTVSDKGDDLSSKFEAFAQTMTKNNTEALVKALRDVIIDFNTKITEQFGDNFKQLNIAVGALVTWQEQYRTTMEMLIPELKRTTEQLQNSNERFRQGLDASAAFLSNVQAIERLTGVLEKTVTGINGERTLMESALKNLATVGQEAKSTIPTVQTALNSMTSELGRNVGSMVNELRLTSNSINSNLDAISKGVGTTLTKFNADFDSYLRESGQKVQGRLQEQSKMYDDRFQKQLDNLDALLKEELAKSLNSFGSVMANVSQKFAADYTPLAERLRSVLEIASK